MIHYQLSDQFSFLRTAVWAHGGRLTPDAHSRQIRTVLATRVYDADDRKEGFRLTGRNVNFDLMINREETIMAWTAPTLVEICVGLEINGYLPAEF